MPPFEPVEDQTEEIIENWDHQIPVTEEDDLYKLLKVVESENRRIDVDLQDLYDNRFVESATGKELEKLGDMVGVVRKTNEVDSKLRKRVKAAYAAKGSDTTYSYFTQFVLDLLETNSDGVSFDTPPQTQPKVVEVNIDGGILNSSVLTKQELVLLFNAALSVDARAEVTSTGTFAFEGDDTSLEGWNEGTWSGLVN